VIGVSLEAAVDRNWDELLVGGRRASAAALRAPAGRGGRDIDLHMASLADIDPQNTNTAEHHEYPAASHIQGQF